MTTETTTSSGSDTIADAPLPELVDRLVHNDPAILRDPYPLYRRLQSEAPVYRHTDKILVTKFEDCREVLTGDGVLQGLAASGSRYRHAHQMRDNDGRHKMEELFEFLEKRLGGANGKRHARLRRLAQRAFTKRQVETMRERVQVIVDTMLDDLPTDEAVDYVAGFAYHVPLIVVCEMLDIPTDGRESLREWSTDLGLFLGADWGTTPLLEQGYDSLFRLRAFLAEVFASHRGEDTTDLLSSLLSAEGDDGDKFTQDELVAMIVQFVFAGHETTTNLISNALILMLGEYREQWELLVSDPSMIPRAIEEVLRFEGPTQNIDKIASQEMVVRGTPIHPWESVSCVLGAANRDPDIFERPDEFDITQERRSHVAFGFGAHHCIGAGLARLEAEVVLETLTRRFPDMQVATDEVEWQVNPLLRGPERLPVVLGDDRG